MQALLRFKRETDVIHPSQITHGEGYYIGSSYETDVMS